VSDKHPIEWRMPSPLWPSISAADTQTLLRPALLRFASDTFMDDLADVLVTKPSDLATLVARPITFRLAGPGRSDDPPPSIDHLKLYQPAHGDFYLVGASLVCRIPGLPDRTVDTAAGDRVSFVLRRLSNGTELAWVADPAAPKRRSWLPVAEASRAKVAAGEELLPMFPVNFVAGDEKRRLLVGYVPTASKESYIAGGTIEPLPTLPSDTRYDELEIKAVQPLVNLRQRSGKGPEAERIDSSRFLLLDLGQFLDTNLPSLWQNILDQVPPPPGDARLLYEELNTQSADGSATTWRAALALAWQQRRDINGDSGQDPTISVDLGMTPLDPVTLRNLVKNALPTIVQATAPAVAPIPVPKLDPRGEARYVLRCVYRRPQCGPLHPDVVSPPSEDFAIASFFDFDAPARDIQITLPADTNVKDLRKFQRNVRVLISDELRRQLSRVSPLKDLAQGDLATGETVNIGWICSFSIPIITICALIVLFIFISLLNIIFWWLPFIRICLPLPLKGK
jgi:hypothetical protein